MHHSISLESFVCPRAAYPFCSCTDLVFLTSLAPYLIHLFGRIAVCSVEKLGQVTKEKTSQVAKGK